MKLIQLWTNFRRAFREAMTETYKENYLLRETEKLLRKELEYTRTQVYEWERLQDRLEKVRDHHMFMVSDEKNTTLLDFRRFLLSDIRQRNEYKQHLIELKSDHYRYLAEYPYNKLYAVKLTLQELGSYKNENILFPVNKQKHKELTEMLNEILSNSKPD